MSLRWKSRLTRLAVAHFVALALIGSSVGLVSAASSVTLDVDGNGTAAASTDGFVIVRFLFGYRGNTNCNANLNRSSPLMRVPMGLIDSKQRA